MEVTPRCRPVINQPVKELERCLRKEFSKAVEDRDKEACQGESTRAAQSLRSRLPSLGEGRYREAFDLGKCVMKVARHFDGARSNALESQAWQNIREMGDPRVTERFAPVVQQGPHAAWLTMRKAAQPPIDSLVEGLPRNEAYDRLRGMLPELGVECRDPKNDNLGVLDGRAVVLDYGIDVKCRIARP